MRALPLCLLVLAGSLTAAPALADLSICNQTDVPHRVAIGYKGDTDWVSEGWWTFAPGECAVVLSGDLKRQNYYYTAQAEGHDYGGSYEFCTGTSPFTIEGDSNCAARGFQRALFLLEDTGPTALDWTIALTGAPIAKPAPTPAPAPAPAPLAGLPTPSFDYIDYRGPLTPGSMGEHRRVEARFLGCENDGYQDVCRFQAEGVDWLVYPSDVNYSETFITLGFLTPGQRVMLDADIVAFNDASVEIAVGRVEAITSVTQTDRIWTALQGYFIDARDSAAQINVVGNTMYELYDGNLMREMRFDLVANCDGTAGTGPGMWLSEPETGWSNCAILTYLGPDGFDYVEMGMMQGPLYRR